MGRSNPQTFRMNAGKQLAKLIKEYGLSIHDISNKTGIDISTLKQLGTFTPHLGTISRIAEYIEAFVRNKQQKRLKNS